MYLTSSVKPKLITVDDSCKQSPPSEQARIIWNRNDYIKSKSKVIEIRIIFFNVGNEARKIGDRSSISTSAR